MTSHSASARVTALLMVHLAVAGAGSSLVAQQRSAPVPAAERLTQAQFEALPEDQPFELRGQRTTKRELRAALATEAAAAKAKHDEAAREDAAQRKAQAESFRKQEDARIERENAKIRSRVALIRQGTEPERGSGEIMAEARQLKERAGKAQSDAERAAIHKRAHELLEQLARQ